MADDIPDGFRMTELGPLPESHNTLVSGVTPGASRKYSFVVGLRYERDVRRNSPRASFVHGQFMGKDV